jgi:hypothetical protein
LNEVFANISCHALRLRKHGAQLPNVQRSRAQLADDHPRRVVRDFRCLDAGRARRQRERERGNGRIARAGNVEDILRARRRVVGLLPLFEQQHPGLAERDQQLADGVFLLEDRPGLEHRRLVQRVREARREKSLAPIWFEHRAARPVERIIRIGIDCDDFAVRLRLGHDQRDQFLIDEAFGVVLDDHRVVGANFGVESVEKPAPALGIERRARFVVHADDLLLVLDFEMIVELPRDRANAGLVRRGSQRGLADAVRGDALAGEKSYELLARLVLTDDAGESRVCAEAGQVARHIGRSARIGRTALDVDHRHGRLGRNARDFAPEKLIQHQVANDENLPAREGPKELRQPLR